MSMLRNLVGILFIAAICSCNNTNNDKTAEQAPQPSAGTVATPKPITFSVDSVYPHDPTAFTQGLEYINGKLYEGTGLEEESRLRIVDPKTGKVEKNYLIPDKDIFGEGITVLNGKIYQLTWRNHKVFVYNQTDITKPVKTLTWKNEGWGITNDGHRLIISDGSSNLYFVSPEDLRVLKIISVTDNTGNIDNLNELELIHGDVFANRWQTNHIFQIDTANGHVKGKMDLTGLLEQYASKDITGETNVLNGIAYDSTTDKLYITGKKWPKMFLVHLNK